MPRNGRAIRVLIVDDHRDGADALGLLLEELGHHVHVTYGGSKALDVVTAYQPDLMLIDLLMPGLDGCGLVSRLRQNLTFDQTRIVAITGQKDEALKSKAMKTGFDAVLYKPATLTLIKEVLATVVVSDVHLSLKRVPTRVSLRTEQRLPIDEARRLRNERKSKTLTQAESEAAICDGIIRFQEEYMGWISEQIYIHFIKDLLLIRILGGLTLAERQLGKSVTADKGRNLIKQVRKQLLETVRPMLESLIHEVTGVKVLSMHHDISTVTGEEVVIFPLVAVPFFE